MALVIQSPCCFLFHGHWCLTGFWKNLSIPVSPARNWRWQTFCKYGKGPNEQASDSFGCRDKDMLWRCPPQSMVSSRPGRTPPAMNGRTEIHSSGSFARPWRSRCQVPRISIRISVSGKTCRSPVWTAAPPRVPLISSRPAASSWRQSRAAPRPSGYRAQ